MHSKLGYGPGGRGFDPRNTLGLFRTDAGAKLLNNPTGRKESNDVCETFRLEIEDSNNALIRTEPRTNPVRGT